MKISIERPTSPASWIRYAQRSRPADPLNVVGLAPGTTAEKIIPNDSGTTARHAVTPLARSRR